MRKTKRGDNVITEYAINDVMAIEWVKDLLATVLRLSAFKNVTGGISSKNVKNCETSLIDEPKVIELNLYIIGWVLPARLFVLVAHHRTMHSN